MYNFTLQIPTRIHFGKDTISYLSELKEYGDKVLLVYGGGSIKKNGIYDTAMQLLKDAALTVFELSGVEPNPRIETVRKGVTICKEEGIDMVLAIGGGSTIDCSKVIAAGAKYDGDAWDLVLDATKIKAALPIFDVLTLSATGTEMDPFAVISDLTKNEKWGTGSPYMVPTMSILNPEYTYSVSKKQTAAGTADMMSHTMENYFSMENADCQKFMAEGLLRTMIKNGPVALAEPDNYEARANLMWAGTHAINGVVGDGCSPAWCVHPMEHELSAFYDITHGEGLAILTPAWMEHILMMPHFRCLWHLRKMSGDFPGRMSIHLHMRESMRSRRFSLRRWDFQRICGQLVLQMIRILMSWHRKPVMVPRVPLYRSARKIS